MIQRRVENPLSRELLAGHFQEGDRVTVNFQEGAFRFERKPGVFTRPQPATVPEREAART